VFWHFSRHEPFIYHNVQQVKDHVGSPLHVGGSGFEHPLLRDKLGLHHRSNLVTLLPSYIKIKGEVIQVG